MCGLFAVIPTLAVSAEFAQKLRFLVRSLARENDTRGGHSWGLWSHDYLPFRGLGRIAESMDDLVMFTDTCWKPKRMNWIAGHTRFGTHGAKTVENSHPFVHGDLTLAHNGVVTVKSDDAEVKAHPVDSGQLCIAISKYGLAEALGNTSGMCGLLFSDANRKLFAYRSDQALHLATCPWGYAISSDRRHLKVALEFCGFFDYEITELPESMVEAPWYEEFEPFQVKTKGRSAYTSTTVYPAYGSCGTGTRWWEKDDEGYEYGHRGSYPAASYYDGKEFVNGVWREKSKPKADATTGPVTDYESKLANGIIKLVKTSETQGTLDEDLDAICGMIESSDVPPLDLDADDAALDIESLEDKTPTLREFTANNGTVHTYDANCACDCCGSSCDDEGGFFFDQECPNVPLSFCSECLEDMKLRGYQSFR